MNLLNIKAIKRTCIKLSHLKNIKYIASLNEDEMLRFLYVFTYGRIVGIQEERSRRQGKDYEASTLVDDTSMQLIKLINSIAIDLSEEEQKDFFNNLILSIDNKATSDRVRRAGLNIIRFVSENIQMKIEECM